MCPCHWRTDGHLDKQQDSQPVGETRTHARTHARTHNIGLYMSRSEPQNVSYAQCHIKCVCCSLQPRFFAVTPSAAVPKLSCVRPSFANGMWLAALPWKRQQPVMFTVIELLLVSACS